jgi:hypothetical protein
MDGGGTYAQELGFFIVIPIFLFLFRNSNKRVFCHLKNYGGATNFIHTNMGGAGCCKVTGSLVKIAFREANVYKEADCSCETIAIVQLLAKYTRALNGFDKRGSTIRHSTPYRAYVRLSHGGANIGRQSHVSLKTPPEAEQYC